MHTVTPPKPVQLVVYKNYYKHVSQDTVNEFERSISAGEIRKHEVSNRMIDMGRYLSSVMMRGKVGMPFGTFMPGRYHKFGVLMGVEFNKTIFQFLFNRYNSVYLFDAWPDNHQKIEWFIRAARLQHVFFSSSQVTELFRTKKLKTQFHWVPEGIDIADYSFRNYEEKDIDVLAFGRKFDGLHNLIVDGLKADGVKYLYEKEKGKLVFPNRPAFIDGLARTKISICIPSAISHPLRSGNINTMTIRYLQSMASKTLIVGVMPEEMKQLFDYTPIVAVDMRDPLGQIRDSLRNFNSYIPLIEKNYQQVLQHHTWGHRWKAISAILDAKA